MSQIHNFRGRVAVKLAGRDVTGLQRVFTDTVYIDKKEARKLAAALNKIIRGDADTIELRTA